ncbi:phosphoethanolamine transferase [Pseudomonas typographi]|uniref:phosphoethanolamine transferase n=1 Tax=Pseudomonas typographi TaxID=2715964 RepID=UPI0016826CD9|nr:phosphoethanolamine--lipid A transferase [Pseudomonas typographi]MBD1554809.1 phosphoethanolamine--lipid A transferase [Pseudomonas typographi]
MAKFKAVRPEAVTLAASILLLTLFNIPLWHHLAPITQAAHGWLLRSVFLTMVLLLFNFVLFMFASRWTLKPLLMLLFVVSAAVAYFMNEYGIFIDASMFRNVAETDASEVRGLLSVKLAGYLLGLGALPCVLLWRLPIHYRPFSRAVLSKFVVGMFSACAVGLLAMANYQGLSSLLRNHHELRLLVVPSNVIGATMAYLAENVSAVKQPFVQVGLDAHLAPAWQQHARKSLTVLVIGESARAENFGLFGYSRDTTPELAKVAGLVAFPDVHSCGTETAVSLPCLFSNLPRKDYSASVAARREGLLDVLKRAGLDVLWIDNQAGCKGACARVAYSNVSNAADPRYCSGGECHDEILLRDLPALLANLKQNTVLVLHQMGSHGPEYYKRVPPGYDHFQPVCENNALNACDRGQIINAYDNTLRYTDHVLSELINTLRSHDGQVDTAMLYVSDHGESLGEYNLFLHGTPYMLAPEQQKHVPMLAWFSDGYQKDFSLDARCLQASRDRPLSHDNVFHSMLGLLQVDSQVYDTGLDMFAGCRR